MLVILFHLLVFGIFLKKCVVLFFLFLQLRYGAGGLGEELACADYSPLTDGEEIQPYLLRLEGDFRERSINQHPDAQGHKDKECDKIFFMFPER